MEFFYEENLWLYFPLILWISGIFYLSSNKGSIAKTSSFLIPFFSWLFPHAPEQSLINYQIVFRKLCHFVGYAILALFASIAFYNSSVMILARFWYFCAFVVVLLVASADEFKQSFYASRSGSFSDVVLDCLGGSTSISLSWLFAEL